jgi:hypothetical protein
MRRLLDNYVGVILTAFSELESVIRARGDFSDFMGKGAAVNIHFNGAATKTIYVDVAAQYPGSNSWTDVGMGRLDPGQRDVQVRIKMDVKEPGQFPLKVSTRPYSGSYITMTSYRG